MGFIFNQNAGETPEGVRRKRAIAEALMSQGMDTSPIQSPWQGVARIAQSLSGNWANSRLDKAEKAGRDAANSGFSSIVAALAPRQQWSQPSQPSGGGAIETTDLMPTKSGDLKSGIAATAQALGISPVDLATAISYETAGTFDPMKRGPTTQWGQHKGLIQFGEPQAKKYGVDWNNPIDSQLGPDGAIAKYLRDTGVQPGMGLLDIYSAINAGGVERYNASDANNGGAPGTVRDKVEKQMAAHRAKAEQMFGGNDQVQPASYQQQPQQQPQQAQAEVQQVSQLPMAQIMELMGNPYLNEAQQGILATVVKQKLATGEWTKANDGTLFNNLTGETKKVDVPRAPMEVSPGAQVYNPETRQVDFSVPALPKEEPTAIKEYLFAKSQGFPGTFQDWEASKRGGMSLQTNPDGTVTFQQGNNIKPLTEAQSKDTVYATRAEGALRVFDEIESGLTGTQGVIGNTVGQLPGVGNYMKSADYQRAEQAGNEFLQAMLRKDTGAAITVGEQALYGDTYLPRPGDSPQVMAQKKAARQRAVAAINAGMTPQAILAKEQALAKGEQQGKTRFKFNPATGELE